LSSQVGGLEVKVATPTFAEWREYGENLGRFASIREKAERPTDRIAIQNKGGVQKLIAGDHGKTIIITVGPTNQPDSMVAVGSRLFLTTMKSLKGKGDAEIRVLDDGIQMQTSFGSTIKMDAMTDPFRFLAPERYTAGDGRVIRFSEGFLPSAAKYLAYTGDFRPFNQVLLRSRNGEVMLHSSNSHIISDVGPLQSEGDFTYHFPDHVFPALRGLEAAGGMYIPDRSDTLVQQAQFGAGKYRVVCVTFPNFGAFPAVSGGPYTASVAGDKAALISVFKSLAGRHQYSRVIMEAKDGIFTVRSGDNGEAKPVVQSTGDAIIPVNASYMAKVLTTVDGKSVTMEFSDAPSNVRVVGDKNGWPMKVAPMK
jgi:hypothetical protein